ncbi:sugar transferase [Candidatus Woesearchaeota archaeon]|nr:sugar transferase [Candidatus Woesearchaeota archaeon]
MHNLGKMIDEPERAIAVPLGQGSLEELCNSSSERAARLNHYAKRLYELPIVVASLPFAFAASLMGMAGVKLEDAKTVIKGEDGISRLYANPFYVQKIVMQDGSEKKQYKVRTMIPDAHSEYKKMVRKGIVRPGDKKPLQNETAAGNKYAPDYRKTPFGRVLRKFSLDEAPQLLQLAAQYLGKGFFYSKTNDNFYFFGNRPPFGDSINNAKPKDREKLRAGPWGLFSLDCVGRGSPGHGREASNNKKYSEVYSKGRIWMTDWYILKNAPKVILGGRNA